MSPSGRFLLRIPPELHRRLRDLAGGRDKSLNELCRDILERAVSGGTEGAGLTSPLELLVQRCRESFAGQLVGIVLFGSVARGEEFPESDLDVLLVMDEACPIQRGLYRVWEANVDHFVKQNFGREETPQ
jgi:predicted nucleotidyltransferase